MSFRPTAMLVCAVGSLAVPAVVVAIGAAATPQQRTATDRAAALQAADSLLGDVVLPAGAARTSALPAWLKYALANPFVRLYFAAQVDVHQLWSVTATPAAVVASIESDLPSEA